MSTIKRKTFFILNRIDDFNNGKSTSLPVENPIYVIWQVAWQIIQGLTTITPNKKLPRQPWRQFSSRPELFLQMTVLSTQCRQTDNLTYMYISFLASNTYLTKTVPPRDLDRDNDVTDCLVYCMKLLSYICWPISYINRLLCSCLLYKMLPPFCFLFWHFVLSLGEHQGKICCSVDRSQFCQFVWLNN